MVGGKVLGCRGGRGEFWGGREEGLIFTTCCEGVFAGSVVDLRSG